MKLNIKALAEQGLSERNIQHRLRRAGDMTTTISQIRAEMANAETEAETDAEPSQRVKRAGVKGISLVNVRISDKKPNETIKAKLYKLPKDKAFPVAALAKEWVASESNVRSKARELNCVRYVEVAPGDWVLCVLHPETAETL